MLIRIAAIALLLSSTAMAAPKDSDVIITLNGKPAVTVEDFNTLMEDFPPQARASEPAAKVRAYLTDRLLGDALLLQAANEAKTADSEEYREVLESYKKFLAREIYMRKKFDLILTDEKLKEIYDKRFSADKLQEEVRARHILVDEESRAKEIIARLQKGGDFEKLAAEFSKDGSAAEGGDLGYFNRQRMVKPFADAAFALKNKGDYTKTPVKTEFGYHVIKLEDRRRETPPPFDSVKEQLREDSINMLREQVLKELMEKTKVDVKQAVIDTIPVK